MRRALVKDSPWREVMQQRIEVHLHIHEGASPAAVEAAVRAAIGNSNGAVTSVTTDDGADYEKAYKFWRRAYTESSTDTETKARPLLEFLVANPERLIPY